MLDLNYISGIHNLNQFNTALAHADTEVPLLIGDSGLMDPLLLLTKALEKSESGVYIECSGRDRNRDSIRSLIISAGAMGAAGIVFVAGRFNREGNMAKPVYDLDPTQMLHLALDLKKQDLLNNGCSLLVRAAPGSETALARARSQLKAGADFIAIEGGDIYDEIREKTAVIVPVTLE